MFDALFRKHLKNVYLILGDKPPTELDRPISQSGRRALYTTPKNFLQVKIDGRETFFEWLGAGRYNSQSERSTMAGGLGALRDVYFGFSLQKLLVRIDFARPAKVALADYDTLRLTFIEPADWELRIDKPGRTDQKVELLHAGAPVTGSMPLESGLDRIFETAIPFETLGVKVGDGVGFFVELLQGQQSRDRAPRDGAIQITRPSGDFERIMWDV